MLALKRPTASGSFQESRFREFFPLSFQESRFREFFPLTETPPGASDFTRSRGVSSLGESSSAAIAADHGGEVVDYGNGEWVVQSAGGDE